MIFTTTTPRFPTCMKLGNSSTKKKRDEFLKSKKQLLDKRQQKNIKDTMKLVRTISKEDMSVMKDIHDDMVSLFRDDKDEDTIMVDFDYVKYESDNDVDNFFTN